MKIGVLTFHFVYNYGAMLQAYALKTFLQRNADECEIIDYRPYFIDKLYRPKLNYLIVHPKQFIRYIKERVLNGVGFSAFESFLCEYLLDNSKKGYFFQLEELKKYSAVFVGSDQVWNPHITNYDTTYLLENADKNVKKFSYAASLGCNTVDDFWRNKMENNLKEFLRISLRETSAVEYVSQFLNEEKVYQSPDPVFLLKREEWVNLEREMEISEKYILYYSLKQNESFEKYAQSLSQKKGISIISIHPIRKVKLGRYMRNIGPREFLWLIHHAEYVCTDSFHATVVSLIFNKLFCVELDTDKGNRINNLFNSCKIKVIKKQNGKKIVGECLENYHFDMGNQLFENGANYLEKCILNINKNK